MKSPQVFASRLLVICGLCFSGLLVDSVCGMVQQEVPTVAAIRDAVEQRKQDLNPVWLKYQINELMTAKLLELSGQGVHVRDYSYTIDVELAVKGNRLRTSHNTPSISEHGLQHVSRPYLHIFDGEKTVNHGHRINQNDRKDVYTISQSRDAAKGQVDPWAICGETAMLQSIDSLDGGKTKVTRLELEGTEIVLEITAGTGWMTRIRLEPEFLLVNSVQAYNDKGVIGTSHTDISYQTYDGIHLPVSATQTSYLMDGSETVLKKREYRLTSCEFDVPDSLFEVEIPRDAVAYDQDRNMTLRDPVEIESRLSEMERQARGEWSVTRLLVSASLIVLVVITLVLFIKSRKAKSS